MPFLEVKGVSKGYGPPGRRTEVLSDINFSIEEGELVAIVGYSGAGKTTLMSMIAGLVAPDTGSITINGKPVTGPGPDRGVVFQTYALLPWLTAFENVFLAVDQVFSTWSAEQKRAHTNKYLDMVKLGHAAGRRPHELSGGMRQRVSVARALAMSPQMLLLDEPLSALDALTRAKLQDEIERIWREEKKTCLLITNDVDEGILLADRIVPLGAGPSATLGPSIAVDIARPRERRTLNHDAGFRTARNAVITYLLGPGRRKGAAAPPQAAPVAPEADGESPEPVSATPLATRSAPTGAEVAA